MSPAGICRMITDIQKCKNDNLFSDQVFLLLMFSNRRECEVAVKTVVIVICISEPDSNNGSSLGHPSVVSD